MYIGKVIKRIEPLESYGILVEIPSICTAENPMPAFPYRNEVDEPKPGDLVMVDILDDVFCSLILYRKVKDLENDNFVGFRALGKMVSITKDDITISNFDKEEYSDNETPDSVNFIKISKDGTIEIKSDANIKIKTDQCTIDSKHTKLTGGTVTMNGQVIPGQGPFNCITNCPYNGTIHSGSIVENT